MAARFKQGLLVSGALLLTSPSFAEDVAAPTVNAQADATAPSGDIIVTATKRGENIQNVAASITAIGGADLERRGVIDIERLATQVPNLNYSEHIGASLIYIRGIGTTVDTGVAEPSVATYVDGIYLPRTTMGLLREVDLDRVEVLRGPQGTLYGRNATAGAINFISRAPTTTLQGGLNVDTGSRNEYGGSAYLSGPVTTGVTFRVSGGYEKQDGYTTVLNTGQHLAGTDVYFFRGAVHLEPTSKLKIDLSVRYDDSRAAKAYQQLFTPAIAAVPPTARQTTAPNALYGDAPFFGSADTLIAASTINWELTDKITLRSVTGFIDHHYTVGTDIDSTDFPLFAFTNSPRTSKSVSQEFNLIGTTGRLNWLLGAYYFHEHAFTQLGVLFPLGAGAAIPAGTFSQSALDEQISSYAAFGDLTYNLTDRLRLEFGFRYNQDNKDFLSTSGLILPNGTFAGTKNVPSNLDRGDFLPKVGLQYDLTDDIHAYVQFQKGQKSGGRNIPGTTIYDPERITSYEGGLKTRLLDNRLTANIAVFHYDFKNLQVLNILPPATSVVQNADARDTGAEIELNLDATKRLRLNAAVALLDAKYTKFDSFDPAFPANGAISLRGKRLNSAPKYTINAGAEWEVPVQVAFLSSIRLRADLYHSDDVVLRYFGTANDIQPAYTTVNAAAIFTDKSDRFSVRVFVNNIGDTLYKRRIIYSATTASYIGNYAEPRTWGAVASVHF